MIDRDEALQMAREANRWAANQTDDIYDYLQIRDERLVQAAYQRGQEMDFDPDALVQNAVYALCGPFGRVAQGEGK